MDEPLPFEKFFVDTGGVDIPNVIRNKRDAQNLNMIKVLEKIFKNQNQQFILLERAKRLPDYETISVTMLATVFYIWSQMGNEEFPKTIIGSNEKAKKNEVNILPTSELQKEIFKNENVTPKIKADIYRYMRYIKEYEKR